MDKKQTGFTLTEIIVTLVILAVLAAAAIPFAVGYVDHSKASLCQTNILGISRQYRNWAALDPPKDDRDSVDFMKKIIRQMYDLTEGADGFDKICPGGGVYTVSMEGGQVVVTCDKHGAVTMESAGINITKHIADLDEVTNFFAGKTAAQLRGGTALDSEATHSAAVAPGITKMLEEAGLDMNGSWRVYFRSASGSADSPSEFNVFWTDTDISTVDPKTNIDVIKYDALTGTYYKGVGSVAAQTTEGHTYNIMRVGETAWEEINR